MQINKKIAYSCSLLAKQNTSKQITLLCIPGIRRKRIRENNSIIRLVINEKSYSRTVILSHTVRKGYILVPVYNLWVENMIFKFIREYFVTAMDRCFGPGHKCNYGYLVSFLAVKVLSSTIEYPIPSGYRISPILVVKNL